MNDADFLRKAITVGNQVAAPRNFGAAVVKDGELLSAEHAQVFEQNNPSLHSEVCAIAAACKKLSSFELDGATLYCSHEPCVMCFSCAAWAHVERIVYATAASEQGAFTYEFKDLSLSDLSLKLTRPMKVEHMPLVGKDER
jgi:guanine deaminase